MQSENKLSIYYHTQTLLVQENKPEAMFSNGQWLKRVPVESLHPGSDCMAVVRQACLPATFTFTLVETYLTFICT